MFSPLPTSVDLPALERAVLARWQSTQVFERSLAQTIAGERYTVFEGPPTANGKPGAHHVEARVFKDLFPRWQTMRGRHVPRRGGWDCHGLPVELAVEKELGFTNKADIEAYGVAEFNARCRESVLRHVDEFQVMSERMGYWVDWDDAYWTMDPAYVESVWWSVAQIYRKGLLVEDHRVAPWCPRCQTGLSDHEVAQGYQDVVDPSVYVRFPVTSEGPLEGANLLVWTTTPWTLVSNVAVAVNPGVTYVLATSADGEKVVVAEPLLAQVVGAGAQVLQSFTGTELESLTYQRPFELVEVEERAHYVVLAEYVTTSDGTGLVHQSPAFGAEDMAVARSYSLPVVNPLLPDGHFAPDVPLVGGVFFKDADADLVADLRVRDLLWKYQPYEHSYPFCWRCKTALLYYATPSWYIRTTAVRDRMLEENAGTDWHPQTIKDGRFGEWLRNNVDWAVSRKRYWGTPMPLWRCVEGHVTVVESLAELAALSGVMLEDPHRPFVDDVTLLCGECGQTATRVVDVLDCWYDSGAMPFAQWHYPAKNGQDVLDAAYPAAMICEAVDQTRGWFYTLLALGTLVFDRRPYEAVLCLGHIVAEDGRKMSKSLGNILEPHALFDQHGADAVRWLMLCGGSPWGARRVGDGPLQEVVRGLLLTYWNTASFFTLYATTAGWDPSQSFPAADVLDRWLLSELHSTVAEVDAALTDFDSARAGRRLTAFVDDLSNWYVRRSRRRFWAGDGAALTTLHTALETLTRLLAPFVPFVTDELWARLVVDVTPGAPDSVHLATWPALDTTHVDPLLGAQMALVRRAVELGRSARATSAVKTRQPLRRALVGAAGLAELSEELLAQIAEELNVQQVAPLTEAGELVDVLVKPNFRALGKRFGARTKDVAVQVSAASYSDGTVSVTLDGVIETLSGDELVVTEQPRSGWAVATGEGMSVALDLELDDELRALGTVRDVVRAVQDARKGSGFDVSDRITLWWTARDEDVAAAVRLHAARLAEEVLATSVVEGPPLDGVVVRVDEATGLRFGVAVA